MQRYQRVASHGPLDEGRAQGISRWKAMKRIERLRLYPSAGQRERLQFCLDVCRQIYNMALHQRRDAWRTRRLSIGQKRQYAELTELREAEPRVAAVYRELQDAALHKLDLAFAAFFRRQRAGEVPGFPRFRSRDRYTTLEFPHGNRALMFNARQSKLRVPGIGSIALRKGRSVPSFGRAMILRSPRGWYALFECERLGQSLPTTGACAGIDMGVNAFLATSDGKLEPHARFGRAKAAAVARAQRRVARRKRSGARRRKAVVLLARAHDALRWARRDWHHKLSRKLIDTYDALVLEKLSVRSLTRSAKGTLEVPGINVAAKAGLNQAILDAGWRQFANMLVAKAEEAGRSVVFVDARYSSQTCASCGHVDAKSRESQSVFCCAACGHRDHADINAATVILQRAKLSPAGRGAALADSGDPRNALSLVRTRVTQRVA
jgi:putative transposase